MSYAGFIERFRGMGPRYEELAALAAQAFQVAGPAPSGPPIAPPVVILCGLCHRPVVDGERNVLLTAFHGWQGTLVSGGTEAGVSAIAGELQQAYPQFLHTIGYLPATMPPDVRFDARYRAQRRTSGADFSLLEPIQYWLDLHDACVPLGQIKLLALGGGALTACECQMALAVGVRVGFIDASAGEASKQLANPPWVANALLQRLPLDATAVRKFLQSD